jgi:hypothetical protein
MIKLLDLTTQQLRRAISIKEEIEILEAQLAKITSDEIPAPAIPGKGRKPHKMSRVGRAAIAAAAKVRWAKVRGEKVQAGKDAAAPKKKRKMSAAGRAKIAAAAKARWAKAKAAGKKRL